jgi:hypothetical protein
VEPNGSGEQLARKVLQIQRTCYSLNALSAGRRHRRPVSLCEHVMFVVVLRPFNLVVVECIRSTFLQDFIVNRAAV